ADEVSLRQIASALGDKIPVFYVLNSLCNDFHSQLRSHGQAGFEYAPKRLVRASPVNETSINLEFIERHIAKLRQRRMACSEVVNGQTNLLETQSRQYIER